MMKIKEFNAMDTADLLQKEKAFKKELFDLNYQKKFGKVEKPARFGDLRRGIARIKTILTERKSK
jgi:large subunit ribosomal protein L29